MLYLLRLSALADFVMRCFRTLNPPGAETRQPAAASATGGVVGAGPAARDLAGWDSSLVCSRLTGFTVSSGGSVPCAQQARV